MMIIIINVIMIIIIIRRGDGSHPVFKQSSKVISRPPFHPPHNNRPLPRFLTRSISQICSLLFLSFRFSTSPPSSTPPSSPPSLCPSWAPVLNEAMRWQREVPMVDYPLLTHQKKFSKLEKKLCRLGWFPQPDKTRRIESFHNDKSDSDYHRQVLWGSTWRIIVSVDSSWWFWLLLTLSTVPFWLQFQKIHSPNKMSYTHVAP